jgi:hypothetical protein
MPARWKSRIPPAAPTQSVSPTVTTPPAAQPAVPINSAATVVSDSNLTPTQLSALSPSAGVTPVSGPGAAPTSNLGDNLNSATTAALPFRITATLSETYNNNIFSTQHKTDDFITRVSATGELQLGALQRDQVQLEDVNYFDAIYTPTLRIYAGHPHENGVDQDVDVIFAHRWTKLTLSLEQAYTSLQTTNASVGGLVTADTYRTEFNAIYVYSPKIDLNAEALQEFTDYDNPDYTDSKEWAGGFSALYHFDPKFALGFGPRFGYLDLHEAPAETYQQGLVRAVYDYSDKLKFKADAGVEYRQYQTYQRSSTLEPIFALAGVYQPSDSTYLSLNAARRFTPSYGLLNNDYIATSVYMGATQRVFDIYYLGLKAGYENDDYSFESGGGMTRDDDYYYVQPTVTWRPNGWLQVEAFDRYEEDSSNFTFFSYDTNQVGVSCSATY